MNDRIKDSRLADSQRRASIAVRAAAKRFQIASDQMRPLIASTTAAMMDAYCREIKQIEASPLDRYPVVDDDDDPSDGDPS